MKFFFPDNQDMIDPGFDFFRERPSRNRVRHRTDHYAHEELSLPPYDGLLVSYAAVDSSRYTLAQKHRLLRQGGRRFFHIADSRLEIMGDCGAFTYLRAEVPPYTVDDLLSFYVEVGVEYGLSLDHVIPIFDPAKEHCARKWRDRQILTLDLAEEFFRSARNQQTGFVPIGVAQGWSPHSYAFALSQLQRMGYEYVALGGVASLRTMEILAILECIQRVRNTTTRLHVLGITRMESASSFLRYGVTSFDSTSPLRQAFKDIRDNYYTPRGTYSAIPVPQTGGNADLLRRIVSGVVDGAAARRLELRCLSAFRGLQEGTATTEEVLRSVVEYQAMHGIGDPNLNEYRRVLEDRPWQRCQCEMCRKLGVEIVLFRGAERNKRRGFHNLFVFRQQLATQLGDAPFNEDPEE